MKNVILFHLESISSTIFWQYRLEMPTAWRLMRGATYFNKFFANATSTETTENQLFCGTTGLIDHYEDFFQFKKHHNYALFPGSIFAYFYDNMGYDTGIFRLDYFQPTVNKTELIATHRHRYCNPSNFALEELPENKRPHFSYSQNFEANAIYDDIASFIRASKNREHPFLLFVNSNVTHMAMDSPAKFNAKTFAERFIRSYQELDQLLGHVVKQLVDNEALENTLIVCYGDHGDELWSHGINVGYCHAIAPYSSLTWTPLFVFDAEKPPSVRNDLVDMTDIRETIIKWAAPGFEVPESLVVMRPHGWVDFRAEAFSGVDVNSGRRELSFAQNLFALQRDFSDLEKGLVKAYSATDGVYTLIAHSSASRSLGGGLELYCNELDAFNKCNLLDLFKLDANGNIVEFSPPPGDLSSDFTNCFTPESVANLTETFHHLKKELLEYVRSKENRALKLAPNLKKNTVPGSVFRKSVDHKPWPREKGDAP